MKQIGYALIDVHADGHYEFTDVFGKREIVTLDQLKIGCFSVSEMTEDHCPNYATWYPKETAQQDLLRERADWERDNK